jgi:hypothetical protein
MKDRGRFWAYVALTYQLSFIAWILAEMQIVDMLVGWAVPLSPIQFQIYRSVFRLATLSVHVISGVILFLLAQDYAAQLLVSRKRVWWKLLCDAGLASDVGEEALHRDALKGVKREGVGYVVVLVGLALLGSLYVSGLL